MKQMMVGGFLIIAGIYGGAQIGLGVSQLDSATRPSPAALSGDGRKAWMEEHLSPIAKAMDRSLPKGNGMQPHMSVVQTNAYPDKNVAEVVIGIKGPAKLVGDVNATRKAILKAMCGNFVKHPFGKEKVVLRTRMMYSDNTHAVTIDISNNACAPYTQAG